MVGYHDIDLMHLNNAIGFNILGAEYEYVGQSVSAGDINGDGYDDAIVGAMYASPLQRQAAGEVHIIFGQASFFDNIDLAYLRNSRGFSIFGVHSDDNIGYKVSSGDINGDGYADILIGTSGVNNTAGASYIVFGKASNFTNIDLMFLDHETGFKITGISVYPAPGFTKVHVGDINGDGYDDIIVGAPEISHHDRQKAGASYVIFGKASNFSDIDLANMDNGTGFAILGAETNDQSGYSISSGDINADGYADIIIGAIGVHNGAGACYIIFGKAIIGTTDIDLATFNRDKGFIISGVNAGDHICYVVSTGDFNADNYTDILMGAPFASPLNRGKTGASYIIFGKAANFSDVNISKLDNATGFSIFGAKANDQSGYSVASGDLNKDGFDEIIIGVQTASPLSRSFAGEVKVIFGKSNFIDIDLKDFRNNIGFSIVGVANTGHSLATGDVNRDSYDDIIVGSPTDVHYGRQQAGLATVILYDYDKLASNFSTSLAWKIFGSVTGAAIFFVSIIYCSKKYYYRDPEPEGIIGEKYPLLAGARR